MKYKISVMLLLVWRCQDGCACCKQRVIFKAFREVLVFPPPHTHRAEVSSHTCSYMKPNTLPQRHPALSQPLPLHQAQCFSTTHTGDTHIQSNVPVTLSLNYSKTLFLAGRFLAGPDQSRDQSKFTHHFLISVQLVLVRESMIVFMIHTQRNTQDRWSCGII